ncbi:MAG: serine/threonine protein phosphatase [Polaromonas sp.]|nr:serine/threonine protein phosphatase [Polaromonas sp.]
MNFDLDIGFVTRAGRKATNEDYCAAQVPPPGQTGRGVVLAIADGVSTGGKGREAAQLTATSVVRDFFGTPETWDATVALDRVIAAQNSWLSSINRRRHPVLGLTTLTVLLLRDQSYVVAHVGDTRCNLWRDGEWRVLTQDHVVAHPDFQHQLLRSMGAEDHVVVDYLQGDVCVGDVFVLTSDGVHGSLSPAATRAALTEGDARTMATALVDAALAAGSNDNVTAMVVRVQGLPPPSTTDAQRRSQALPVPPALKVGERLDGWVVTSKVADNGINLLYQVRDPVSQRLYALKTLHPARAHDPDERAMLLHEAWLSQRMQRTRAMRHLVTTHDPLPNGEQQTAFYVLFDWHSGKTWQQMLDARQPLAPTDVVGWALQVLQALGQLHRQGIIHRDIKPANLHLGEDGVVRVLDLGVALSGREPESMRRLHAGTPSYVNPEQWGYRASGVAGIATDAAERELANAQSDLFALGVTLYQMVTGRLPYGEVLLHQVGRYHSDPKPPHRLNPQVPMWLNHAILKAVARDQRLRYETAEEFALVLERGASRPLTAPTGSPLLQRDPTALWKILLATSVLFNLLLVVWLLFLPR